MCLAKVYLKKNNEIELLWENIASVEILGNKLILGTIFMEAKEIKARLKKIDFANSNILLEEYDE